ncbi:DUF2284 domain-containing protein [Desulfosporosinus sp. Sb-LF]|uniref:DUF2284 domain-containing protein n=1 Tax=Desulfosporosinus sp. Sb-LF TaxID=2560027 RepID=UPI001FB11416|nr:DUF2284 domain-containing protein [Desulfosporosinus sp. Sb-LF]
MDYTMQIEGIMSREKMALKIHEYAFIKAEEVIFSQEVRGLCEKNSCGMYGTSWACPPAIGSIEDCKKQCLGYKHALIFTTVTRLKKKYDMAGWREARIAHEAVTEKVAQIFRKEFSNPMILSTEGCTICPKCTYPENPCRFPKRMFPATEGFGILVMQLAPSVGIRYNNGSDTVTYFSMIFFSE